MKKIIILLFSLCVYSFGAITLKTVVFNDQEELQSTYIIKYQQYQYLINTQLTATQAGYITTCRNNGTPTLSCASTAGLTTANLMRIREAGYLQENQPINSLGLKLFDFNYLMALAGLFIGVLFAFGLIYSVMNISRHKV